MRSTLRRNAMTTSASVHCVSRQVMFSDLSRTGFRKKVLHPRHHCLVTTHIISHWILYSSWNFWISCSSWNFWVSCSSWNFWILRSYKFGPGRQPPDSESPDSGIASILFSIGFMQDVVHVCVTSTLTVRFDIFSQDTIRSQSRTVQLYVFLEIIWQQSFKGTHANFFCKIVCISLSVSSATAASHEIFHLLDGAHEFRQLCSRRRQNLPQETSCSSRCVRVPPSVQLAPTLEPADMTMSKLSPSLRAANTTKSYPSVSADVSTPSLGTPIATVAAVTTSCDSAANVKAPRTFGNTPDT